MTWIVIALITVISLVTVSLVFGSSTYSSMPGAKVDVSVLGEGELLIYEYDTTKGGMIQDKHKEVERFVGEANHYYRTRTDLQHVSDVLLQAVECYENIRDQANSAVVELNLAILAKARLKVEQELNDDQELIDGLEEYLAAVLEWAGQLLNKEPKLYDPAVKACYDKLNPPQDGRA